MKPLTMPELLMGLLSLLVHAMIVGPWVPFYLAGYRPHLVFGDEPDARVLAYTLMSMLSLPAWVIAFKVYRRVRRWQTKRAQRTVESTPLKAPLQGATS